MGRPRSGEGTSGPERLEAALFELMRTTPFQGLSVSVVVRAAGVNRNSFYYHYDDLEDLAHSAASHALIREMAQVLASGLAPASDVVDRLLEERDVSARVERLILLVGSHSTPQLRDIVKESMRDVWLAEFDLELSDLEPQELASIEFILGGAMALVSRIDVARMSAAAPDTAAPDAAALDAAVRDDAARDQSSAAALKRSIAQFRRLPVLALNARALADTLREAAERKRGR